MGHYANNFQSHNATNQPLNLTCYKWGQVSHLKRDRKAAITEVSRQSRVASNQALTARTFNITVKNAMQNTNVTAGTLLLNSISTNVLIDSGATRSFVSRVFSWKLNPKVKFLSKP